MKTTVQSYNHGSDYERVSQFLVKTYSTTDKHINWEQPRWEYMHYHPLIKKVDLKSFGVWAVDGEIVGIVHLEFYKGEVYFEIDPAYTFLKSEMLAYAKEHLFAETDGVKVLNIFINDRDDEFQKIVAEAGYVKQSGFEATTSFVIPDSFPAIKLPDGFRLKSLAEDNDLKKLNRVLFRGFNHGNEPPDDGIEDMRLMQSAPNYPKDLNIVVEAPDGNFVSYCGMWYEPVHRLAYPEPVCTDPDYRRMGLGRAVVLESLRRCGELGAKVAYCSTIPLYLSIGFRPLFNNSIWQRKWT
jgi:GNAT superfamily N-acetyltransferase